MEYLYKKYAKYYDLIYASKGYDEETKFIKEMIRKHSIKGRELLEVGCGTGNHAVILQKSGFRITGIDLNEEMLSVARKKTNKIKFAQGDMRSFRLNKKFDILLCLFSTIHYNQSTDELKKTLQNFHSHLRKGGLLIFDMGFNEERWDEKKGRTLEDYRGKDMDLVRFDKSTREGKFGLFHMAYILFKDNKFNFGSEVHKLRIFKTPEVKRILENVGFDAEIYSGYTKKRWDAKSQNYVVFAAVKR
jgi:SAM-dependent methyltransferase